MATSRLHPRPPSRRGRNRVHRLVRLPYPIVAETIGREGFRRGHARKQHGLWDTPRLPSASRRSAPSGAAPLVRVPVGDFAMARRALDFGAEGVIAPMINTAADASAFVAAAKYPPLGERSWGPHRATTLAGIADRSDICAKQTIDRHARHDRDQHRARQSRSDRRMPGIDGSSSVRPISRSR